LVTVKTGREFEARTPCRRAGLGSTAQQGRGLFNSAIPSLRKACEAELGMTANQHPAKKPRLTRRLGLLLAGGALVVIVVVVTVVRILAGGNQTRDGSGRDGQSTQQTMVSTPNVNGSGAGGPVR
jgi:hypothetical protein